MSSPGVKELGVLEGPLLIFGGSYGNLAATAAMRSVAQSHGIPPEQVICTGDLVAYCAEPEETVCLVREWGIEVVLGNCEQSLALRAIDCGCGFETGSVCSALSAEWFAFADRHISADNRHWMGALPQRLTFELCGRRFAVIHGGVAAINRFLFASTPETEKIAEVLLLGDDIDGILAGHCGLPFGQVVAGKAWLNAGVIGMPANDGTRDGWYLLLEPVGENLQARWCRLSYPAEQTRQSMLSAGLTSGYADAILSGLWPSEDVLPMPEKRQRGKALGLAPLIF